MSTYDPLSSDATGVATGPDGALWLTFWNGSIGRITTSGAETKYTVPNYQTPTVITSGPDGAMWYTAPGDNSIERITVVPSVSLTPATGPPGTSAAASGGGYTPGEQVNVTYLTGLSSPSTLPVCTAIANPNGTFACTGDIPPTNAGANGSHTVNAKGATSLAKATTTFTLT